MCEDVKPKICDGDSAQSVVILGLQRNRSTIRPVTHCSRDWTPTET